MCAQRIVSRDGQGMDDGDDHIIFVDDSSMVPFYDMDLPPSETCLSCISFLIEIGGGVVKELVIVGTAFVQPNEEEPSTGRILVFVVSDDKRVTMVAHREVPGAVFCLCEIQSSEQTRLVAGIGSKVQLFKFFTRDDPSASYELQPEAAFKGCVLALVVRSHGDLIVVGDLMRSVVVLRYRSSDGVLEELSRDYHANFMKSVEAFDEEYFLGTEDAGNLFVLRRQCDGATDEERNRLELHAELHLGDYVNVFRKGCLTGQPSDAPDSNFVISMKNLSPVLYGTVSGTLGTIIPLTEDAYRFYSALERSIALIVPGIGGLSHSDWRSFCNERRNSPARNMVDGDLVELFVELSKDDMLSAVRRVNDELSSYVSQRQRNQVAGAAMETLSVEEVRRRVEDIIRMH